MLTTRQKFSLMLTYTRPSLTVSGMGSIVAFLFMAKVGIGSLSDFIMLATILKILIISISFLLLRMLASKDRDYFYINIGIHPRILMRWSITLDASVYLAGCILITIIRNVIAG